MQKTALEWFAQVVSEMGYVSAEVLEEARQKELNQIIEAYQAGAKEENEETMFMGFNYFNETYGN